MNRQIKKQASDMRTNGEEKRNAAGRLIAKWYPDKGVIEIWSKGCRSVFIVPPGTPIEFDPGILFAK